MARLHLFEIEDQPWCPRVLRDASTAYLRQVARVTGQQRRILPLLARALDRAGTDKIVDLCSGGGGTIPDLVADLSHGGQTVHATLTDLYPNQPAFERACREGKGLIAAHPQSVDAAAVPRELDGLRTIFNGFHHFKPETARDVLRDAVDARRPIAIVELVGRSPPMLFGMLFAWIGVLVIMPTVRPVNPMWLLWTYLVPLVPALVLWDGLVSCLRVYSTRELENLVAGLDGYDWEIGTFPLGPPGLRGTYLIGVPDPKPAD